MKVAHNECVTSELNVLSFACYLFNNINLLGDCFNNKNLSPQNLQEVEASTVSSNSDEIPDYLKMSGKI